MEIIRIVDEHPALIRLGHAFESDYAMENVIPIERYSRTYAFTVDR